MEYTSEMILSPKLDIVFKMLFSKEKNKDILKAFLSDMLDIPENELHNVIVKNTEINPESINEKYYRLDLNVDIGTQLVNVEMQVRAEDFFAECSLIYWAKLYSSQLDKGTDYKEVCPCIAVNIVDYDLFEQHDDFRSVFETWDKEHGIRLTDKMQIYFFELRKIKSSIKDDISANNRKKLWLQFIRSETKEEFEMLRRSEIPAITKAVNSLYDMSDDEHTKEMVRMRQKALSDKISELASAERKGRAEREAEIVSKLLASGMSESQIKKILNS